MNRDASNIVGKTISGVMIKESNHHPRAQLFLMFTDNSYYEFYSRDGSISQTKGLSRGNIDDVHEYMSDRMSVVFERQSSNDVK